MKLWQVTLSSITGAFLGTLGAAALLWYWKIEPVFGWLIDWWNGPIGAIPAIDLEYRAFWLPLIIIAGIFAAEGAAIAYGVNKR